MQRELEPEVMDSPEEAAEYDAMDHAEPNRAFVERLRQLGARGRMLDLGTGPGDIPLMVVGEIDDPDAIVVGIDLSKSMLTIARRKMEQSPHRRRLSFEFGDVKDIPFEAGKFDTVFSNTILHHIPEPAAMLAEAWRVLKPGGVLLIRDLYRPPDEPTLDALVAEHAGDANDHQRAMFRASLKAALTPDELRELAASVGMVGVEVVIDTDRHMSLQTKG